MSPACFEFCIVLSFCWLSMAAAVAALTVVYLFVCDSKRTPIAITTTKKGFLFLVCTTFRRLIQFSSLFVRVVILVVVLLGICFSFFFYHHHRCVFALFVPVCISRLWFHLWQNGFLHNAITLYSAYVLEAHIEPTMCAYIHNNILLFYLFFFFFK